MKGRFVPAKHEFGRSLGVGKWGESRIDTVLATMFEHSEIDLFREKSHGMDRLLLRRDATDRRYSAEYKTDVRAAQTRNIFVEVVSNDTTGAPGWAVKSVAQLLFVYVPHWDRLYGCSMLKVKHCLPRWEALYERKPVRNGAYRTWGLPVPVWPKLGREGFVSETDARAIQMPPLSRADIDLLFQETGVQIDDYLPQED